MNQNRLQIKKTSRFWQIYTIITASLALLLVIGLIILADYLSAFEKSQPIHAARTVFDEYFASHRFEEALEKAGFTPTEFETPATAATVLKTMSQGKEMTFYPVSAPDNEARYNVVVVNPEDMDSSEQNEDGGVAVRGVPSTKIATISLTKSKESGKWGLYPYEFSALEINASPQEKIQALVPSTYHLFINDKEVPATYIAETSAHPFNAFLPDGVKGIEVVTYKVDGLFSAPRLTCTDESGQAVALVEENGAYSFSLSYDSTLQQKYAKRVLDGMKEYAKYIQNDGSLAQVAAYFDTSSIFYKNVTRNLSQFVWDHNGYEFKNETADEFYAFDENTFCCHVSFDQVLHLRGREDYVDSLDMIVFCRKKGNNVYIFDRADRAVFEEE